jgi:hypothetical protein
MGPPISVPSPTTPPDTGPTPDGRRTSKGSGASNLAGRQATSQAILRWDWDHAYAPTSRSDLQALEPAAAYAALAQGDARPLLVLRECEACRGTTDAFLSRELDNEKTILLGRWFHAVKLPTEVLDETNTFHGLFAAAKPAHLFVATADGSVRVDLSGNQSQAALWSAMTKVLRQSYAKDPNQAVSGFRKLLDELDDLDSRIAQAEDRLAAERAAHGPDALAGNRQDKDLAALRDERTAALERGVVLDDLQLKPR